LFFFFFFFFDTTPRDDALTAVWSLCCVVFATASVPRAPD